jgi:cytochrome bd-type quinol oxidase subunit 1
VEYPIWQLTTLAGGFWIALIAVVHVYVAHFAVGGGLFLVLTEHKARRENSPTMLAYVKKHTKFFLLLSMVFGGLTGVGIWFSIALISPQATSSLIHTFVFGWATEWVCFVGEIVALLVYFYAFDRMKARDHLIVGWLYFIFAWLSLFFITGIIDFMLAPGRWIETGNFWDGFFNPVFWPSVLFRTFIACIFAGLFGFVTATRIEDEATRLSVVRSCSRWTIVPFIGVILSAWWYVATLPDFAYEMVVFKIQKLGLFVPGFLILGGVIMLGGLFMAVKMPATIKRPAAFVLLAIGLGYMGCFEFSREAARKPYLINEYMYSNSILPSQVEDLNRSGVLPTAKWSAVKSVSAENELQAGKELFQLECASCHSIGGPMNNILPLTEKFTVFGMDSHLNGQGKLVRYMPPFVGTKQERWALARYVVDGLHKGNPHLSDGPSQKPVQLETPVPAKENDEYVLLAWNNLGMHCISDSDPYWTLLPPANDIFAQLIKRGEWPEIITQGVELSYQVEDGFENPAGHVRFWEFARPLFGLKTPLPENVGLSGNKVAGVMQPTHGGNGFEAALIPVVPYPDDGTFNPYPLFTVTARDKETGRVLATTRCVAPTSTEMGCKNCHGGTWRVAGVAGFTDETSSDILAVHDRINKTTLLADARNGKPRLCQSCHADPVLGTKGMEGVINFPAAIHGWHANYLTERDENACYRCHPSKNTGATGCLRGVHAGVGLTCINCHGTLEDHALSLLKFEEQRGIEGASRLMAQLTPRVVDSKEAIRPRNPWVNEPDCLNCHVDFEPPASRVISGFNTWTAGPEELFRSRTGDMGIMCEACHGSTHANYPATNIYGRDRDNIPPLQYQGNNLPIGANGNCNVCHTQSMEGMDGHHYGMNAAFRNMDLISTK